MIEFHYGDDDAIARAVASLSVADRRRCSAAAHGETGGFVLTAPDDLAEALGGAHPPLAPPPSIVFKADIFRRCTDPEAESMAQALAVLPLRKRMIFDTAQYISSDDADFDELRQGMAALFGEARVAELLASS